MYLRIIFFVFILLVIYTGVFVIPDSAEKFSLKPAKVYEGELWRFLTYQFAHLNLPHLVENIIALFLLGLITLELKTLPSDFSTVYLTTGFLAILPIWFVMKFTALGASSAVYGGYGLASIETRKYDIKPAYVLAVLIFVIFAKTLFVFFFQGYGTELIFNFRQALSHFSGLVFGIFLFFLLNKIKPIINWRKMRCLRGDYNENQNWG